MRPRLAHGEAPVQLDDLQERWLACRAQRAIEHRAECSGGVPSRPTRSVRPLFPGSIFLAVLFVAPLAELLLLFAWGAKLGADEFPAHARQPGLHRRISLAFWHGPSPGSFSSGIMVSLLGSCLVRLGVQSCTMLYNRVSPTGDATPKVDDVLIIFEWCTQKLSLNLERSSRGR